MPWDFNYISVKDSCARQHFKNRLMEHFGPKLIIDDKYYEKINRDLCKSKPVHIQKNGRISVHKYLIYNQFVYIIFNEIDRLAKTCVPKDQTWQEFLRNKK